MAGSGGTFGGNRRSPSDIAEKLREQTLQSAAAFETTLASEFSKLLAKYNARQSTEVQEHLEGIKILLSDELETTFDTLFGGSVAKHTFVDGISDVDSLLILEGSLEKQKPSKIIRKVCQSLQKGIANAEVTSGRVAITVKYRDGLELQLVPTVRAGDKLRVPAWEKDQWSTIDPRQFRDALTQRNQECAGKLIPTLKLAKAVNFTLPESLRLTGYHIESLGIAAFRDYTGEKTTVRMLPFLFKKASDLVLTPMRDRTGQSIHVDEYLGDTNSDSRVVLSHTLARIHQRMMNASAAASPERWRDLLGE